MSRWTKQQMRIWVRRHFAEYIRLADMGDVPDEMLNADGMDVFSRETERMARLIERHLLQNLEKTQ